MGGMKREGGSGVKQKKDSGREGGKEQWPTIINETQGRIVGGWEGEMERMVQLRERKRDREKRQSEQEG